MLYYKYMSERRFKETIFPEGIFMNVSRPEVFNDPFDCMGFARGVMSEDCARRYCEDWCKGLPGDRSAVANAHLCGLLARRGVYNPYFRLLCLSDSSKLDANGDLLLWSHYADNAKGIRVGFEFDGYDLQPHDVLYEDQPPVLECPRVKVFDVDDSFVRCFLRRCVFTKCKAWQYEAERRVVFPLNHPDLLLKTAVDGALSPHKQDFVWHPSRAMIKEVCIGPACRDVSVPQSHVSLLQKAGYGIDLKVARLEGPSYLIRYAHLECA